MKIIGCGGRDYILEGQALIWVTEAIRILDITEIIDGGAPGADLAFHLLALGHGIDSVRFFANWKKFDKSAGPIRNGKQLRYLVWSGACLNEEVAVFALQGGAGTRNMIVQAVGAGIRVIAPTEAALHSNIPISTTEVYNAHLR